MCHTPSCLCSRFWHYGYVNCTMSDPKTTKLNIREDRPTALSSSAHGSNIDAIGFNISFLAQKNPKMAIDVMRLYSDAHEVKQDDPPAAEEDHALFADELHNLQSESGD